MKSIIFALFLPACTFSQKKWNKPFISKNDVVIYSAQFIAGAADGLHEVILNHTSIFERVCPGANMNWWDPKKSEFNKRHFLTILSDGYHTTRTVEHAMNYFSIAVSMADLKSYSKKELPLLVLKRMLLCFAFNRIAFRGVYDGVFRR